MHRRRLLATVGTCAAAPLAGCNGIGVADTDDGPLTGQTVRVGVLAPRPDRNPDGASIVHGAELAADHFGDRGIGGADVELVVADTDFDPGTAREAHERLCVEEGCDLTVGLYRLASVNATLPGVVDHETVHLTTACWDGRPSERVAADYDRYRYHFRAGMPSHLDVADALVELATEFDLGWERIAVVTEPLKELDAYHTRLVERLSDRITVPFARHVAPTAVGSVFDDAKAASCDALLTGYWLRGLGFVEQWASEERPFALGGVHVPVTYPGAWTSTDGSVESAFSLTAPTPRPGTDTTERFLEGYRERFGQHPMYSGATTYDALRIYREAVEAVLDAGDGSLPAQDAIVESLESTTLDGGVAFPKLEFTGPGAERVHEPVWDSMAETGAPVVQQWQRDGEDGVREAVAPVDASTASYRRPPWMQDD